MLSPRQVHFALKFVLLIFERRRDAKLYSRWYPKSLDVAMYSSTRLVQPVPVRFLISRTKLGMKVSH